MCCPITSPRKLWMKAKIPLAADTPNKSSAVKHNSSIPAEEDSKTLFAWSTARPSRPGIMSWNNAPSMTATIAIRRCSLCDRLRSITRKIRVLKEDEKPVVRLMRWVLMEGCQGSDLPSRKYDTCNSRGSIKDERRSRIRYWAAGWYYRVLWMTSERFYGVMLKKISWV